MRLLAQQKASRLRGAVTVEPGVRGKRHYMDYVGSVSASKITNRHGDSPLNSTPHSRRAIDPAGYDTGDLIDDIDKVRILDDMSSSYTQAHGAAMGRSIDDVIIECLFADARAGEEAARPSPSRPATRSRSTAGPMAPARQRRPDHQQLIEAKVKLDGAEAGVDPDEPRFIACSAKQIGNLLATTETTSSDYNNVKALVEGKIDKFMGFTFIRTERLAVDGSRTGASPPGASRRSGWRSARTSRTK